MLVDVKRINKPVAVQMFLLAYEDKDCPYHQYTKEIAWDMYKERLMASGAIKKSVAETWSNPYYRCHN